MTMMKKIHRICYQNDEVIVTACGLTYSLSRKRVAEAEWLTIWRGKQTCRRCPDELDDLPAAAIHFLQIRNQVQSPDDAEAS